MVHAVDATSVCSDHVPARWQLGAARTLATPASDIAMATPTAKTPRAALRPIVPMPLCVRGGRRRVKPDQGGGSSVGGTGMVPLLAAARSVR